MNAARRFARGLIPAASWRFALWSGSVAVAVVIAAIVTFRAGSETPHPDSGHPQPLVLGEPIQLPLGLDAYYFPAGMGKDGAIPDLRRAFRDADGLHETRLFSGELTNAYSISLNLPHGLIGVGVCEGWTRGQNCGTPSFPATGDAQPVGYISRDRGETFTRLGPLPRGAWLHAVVDDQLLVGIYPEVPASTEVTFQLFPSRVSVPVPVSGAVPRIIPNGDLVWLAPDHSFYRPDGSLLWRSPTLGQSGGLALALVPSGFLDSWWDVTSSESEPGLPTLQVGLFDTSGELQRTFSWYTALQAVVQISPTEVLGNVGMGDASEFPAMLLDFETGIIHPIPELTQALRVAGEQGEPFIVAAEPPLALAVHLLTSPVRIKPAGFRRPPARLRIRQ